MEKRKKIIAAISAAIYMYLEQEALGLQTMYQVPQQPAQVLPSLPITSPWSLAGRMSLMEGRFNWQYRLCKSS